MSAAADWIDKLPWGLLLLACVSLGLAPFAPPHIVEKLRMLAAGKLSKPINIFDLAMHGAPWGAAALEGRPDGAAVSDSSVMRLTR